MGNLMASVIRRDNGNEAAGVVIEGGRRMVVTWRLANQKAAISEKK